MKSDLKALIFDLDGTLADTIPTIAEAVNMTLSRMGYPSRTEDEVRSFIGRGPKHLITKSLGVDAQSSNDELITQALKLYDEMYAETYMHTDKLYDGIYDALVELSKKYKIAVLSNKPWRRMWIRTSSVCSGAFTVRTSTATLNIPARA